MREGGGLGGLCGGGGGSIWNGEVSFGLAVSGDGCHKLTQDCAVA